MKQVIQNFKTGELYVDEVPQPSISQGMVLVENRFSLISAGTERGTVKVAQANLIGKAKQRPDLVKQVLQNIKREGLMATIEKVRTKLDSLKALGYSTAGVVVASLDTKGMFKPGDRVACAGGNYASHAEVVAIPQNLLVKIPDEVSFEDASYTTLGAIALQGVRQADPKLGDHVCVIGLGLLGQLSCQLLKANGCNVFGIDVSQRMVDFTLSNQFAGQALNRKDENLLAAIDNFTGGHGFDSVIITAAVASNDPIELSTEISRRKGRIVVVGAVNMDIPREPHFYKKELELRISCSYGPGRYDNTYEENGQDYPYAYVRWTEQRNMQAFLRLANQGALNLKPLTTHIYGIDEAESAYDLVLGKIREPSIGILLKYDEGSYQVHPSPISVQRSAKNSLNIAFIGAGSFAQSYLIPNVKAAGASLDTVVTGTGINAKNVAQKFGFNNASTNADNVFSNPDIDTVFIATRHNSHGEYVLRGLESNKNVYVEKPLAIDAVQLSSIQEAYTRHPGSRLMVGFNRRFSPAAVKAKQLFAGSSEPKVINYRINAGYIAKDHWIQDEELGGGRIVGEVCHFIDLLQYLTGAAPVKVYAECIGTGNEKIKADDNVSIVIRFSDGSVGTIVYHANGDKSMPKERVEISAAEKIALIDDFKKITTFAGNKSTSTETDGKGHKEEVLAFISAIKEGKDSPIPFESLYLTTLATFKILDSLRTGLPQEISLQ